MNKKASLLRTTVVVKDFERQVSFYSDAVNLELMKTIKIPSSRISAHPICASNLGSTMTLGFMQSGGQTMLGLMAFDCEVFLAPVVLVMLLFAAPVYAETILMEYRHRNGTTSPWKYDGPPTGTTKLFFRRSGRWVSYER